MKTLSTFVKESALAFVVATLMLPGAIAFAAVLLFLTGPFGDGGYSTWNSYVNRTPGRACLWAAVIALGFCVALGSLVCRRFTRATSACPGPFDELRERLEGACERLQAFAPPASVADVSESWHRAQQACYEEAKAHVRATRVMFQGPQLGFRWLLGTGYIDAWRRLHAIEQSLIMLAPAALVLGGALDDELRLQGSTITQRDALLRRLRVAVPNLSETGAAYLAEQPAGDTARAATQGNTATRPASGAAPPAAAEYEARAVLAEVRGAITDFRDGVREAMVRTRNRLFAAVIFAGITGCVLLYVAMLARAPKDSILAAAAFYLVGGLIGLVRQLQLASTTAGSPDDDYGLGVVRLIHAPLLSGLAAIGGVVLIKLTQGQTQSFSLHDTFDLGENPYGLVAAAIFGLTPSLLLAGLQRRVDQYRTDLSASASSDAHAPSRA